MIESINEVRNVDTLIEMCLDRFDYVTFWKGSDYMSNFYRSAMPYEHKGKMLTFYYSEQLFMFLKALHFENEEQAMRIHDLGDVNPNIYRKIGRELPNYEVYGESWEDNKESLMYFSIHRKFTEDPMLARMLLETSGKVLIEASPYDRYWGIGLDKKDKRVKDPRQWRGENALGFLLMELRSELEITNKKAPF